MRDIGLTLQQEYNHFWEVTMPDLSRSLNPFITQGMIRDPRLFCGRAAELAAIWNYLRRDANVSIVAERRMGKSSLLWYVRAKAREEFDTSVEAHYLDLELVSNAEEFFSRLAEMLGLEESEVSTRDLERALADRRVILCLDEFDRAAYNEAFPPDFFAILRGLSQGQNLTLVVATKTPLIDFSANGGWTSPFYNIFPPTPILLGLMPDDEARDLLIHAAARAGIEFSAETLANALKLAGGVPWHLQLIGWHWVEARQNWPEAERRYREALRHANGGNPAPPGDQRPAGPGRPAWVPSVVSVLGFLSSVIMFFSLALREAWGVGLGVVFALGSLALYVVYYRLKSYG